MSDYIDIHEAAKILKVSKSTLAKWTSIKGLAKTKIPVRKHGRKSIFLRDELLQWSSQQKQ